MHRKEVTHSDGSYEKKSRRRIWLTKWDKVKAHDTLIDWCTGREWPLNCMTVICARWQTNMPSQRQRKGHISDGKLWGDIEWAIELGEDRKSVSWRSDELETRCSREKSTQQKAGPSGLRLSRPGERERHNADGHKSGGQYVAVLFGLQLPLTRKPYNKVRDIFFKRSLRSSLFIASICILHESYVYEFRTVGYIYRLTSGPLHMDEHWQDD